MSIYKKRSLPMQKSANMYYKSVWFFFINGFLWFNCDILLFAYFRSCLQTMSLAFLVVVYDIFRSCLQIMLRALLLLYWPLMFKPLYICICMCHYLSMPANCETRICISDNLFIRDYYIQSIWLYFCHTCNIPS